MWPYSTDEHVWFEPSKEWAEKRPTTFQLPKPANDIDGAWPYITAEEPAIAAEEPAEDQRPIDPQIFVGK
jgi:hypothetical protein